MTWALILDVGGVWAQIGRDFHAKGRPMRRLCLLLAFLFVPSLAGAQCFADYKAKQDDPLQLHYGVVELQGACDAKAAADEIAGRIAGEGWVLLQVLSTFGPDELSAHEGEAGAYFLRY